MSNSHRIPLGDGHEQDMLTKARRFYSHGRGRSKRAKQSYNRRQRRILRRNPDA